MDQVEAERKSERIAKKSKSTSKSSINLEDEIRNELLEEIESLRKEIRALKSTFLQDLKLELTKQVRNTVIDELMKENASLREKVRDSGEVIENLSEQTKSQYREICDLKDSVYWAEVEHDRLEQYNRRNNLEIAGISDIVNDRDLEAKAIEILQDAGVSVSSADIEACHRLPKSQSAKSKNLPKRTIIRFVNRKNVECALKNKKNLKNTRKGIYFNENLCRNYREIWYKCRSLHSDQKIHSYFTYSGTVFYRISESAKPVRVDHITDLDTFDTESKWGLDE